MDRNGSSLHLFLQLHGSFSVGNISVGLFSSTSRDNLTSVTEIPQSAGHLSSWRIEISFHSDSVSSIIRKINDGSAYVSLIYLLNNGRRIEIVRGMLNESPCLDLELHYTSSNLMLNATTYSPPLAHFSILIYPENFAISVQVKILSS